MPRTGLLLMLIGVLIGAGCAHAFSTAPAAHLPESEPRRSVRETLAGLWRLEVDPHNLTASIAPTPLRRVSDNDDLYLLAVNRFFTGQVIRIRNLRTTESTLEIEYTLAHPFPPPADPAGPATATNRADLGIAGRVAFLVDVPSPAGNTYFADRIANTALIANADHYYAPAGTLPDVGLLANTFPCQRLVDETGEGSRVDIGNGGDPTGNFGTDGWTRAKLGPEGNGWTGYGVLHQGQVTERTVALNLAALNGLPSLQLDVACFVRYNDPRQGPDAATKRAHRLPSEPPDPGTFSYRMPHGAVDCEWVHLTSESGTFESGAESSSTLSFQIIDWDARAQETTAATLSEDPAVTTVAVGESGIPALAICIPGVLGDATVLDHWDASTLTDDDREIGGDVAADSGIPGDALWFRKAVTKPVGIGNGGGNYTGMVRVRDPEYELAAPLAVALDGITLAPLTVDLPHAEVYQAFTIAMQPGVTGEPGWVSTFGDEDFATVHDLAANGGGDASIAGRATSAALMSPFIHAAQYTSAGAERWARAYTSTGIYQANGVEVDALGNTYLTGYFPAPIDFGQGVITPAGASDGFVIKLGLTGDPIWVRTFGHPAGHVRGAGLSLDSLGRVLTVGSFAGTISFGGSTRVATGTRDGFVLQLSSGGIYQWDRAFTGTAGALALPEAVATGADDSVYIAGQYQQTVDFGGGPRSAVGESDGFVARLSVAGAFQWDFGADGAAHDEVSEIAVDQASGDCYGVGMTAGPLLGQPLSGPVDGLLFSLASTGSVRWARLLGGTEGTSLHAVAWHPVGRLYAVGSFSGTCTPCSDLPSAGDSDAFLLRLLPDGTTVWRRQIGGPGEELGVALDLDGAGDLRLGGSFEATVDFDPGPGVVERTAIGTDGFVLRLSGSTGWM